VEIIYIIKVFTSFFYESKTSEYSTNHLLNYLRDTPFSIYKDIAKIAHFLILLNFLFLKSKRVYFTFLWKKMKKLSLKKEVIANL